MEKQITCIGCPLGCAVTITMKQGEITSVTGYTCSRGEKYARKEVTHPTRIVTSIVKVNEGDIQMVSVKTESDIPKDKIFDCMEAIREIVVTAPVKIGDIIVPDVCGTGVNVIATKNIDKKLASIKHN